MPPVVDRALGQPPTAWGAAITFAATVPWDNGALTHRAPTRVGQVQRQELGKSSRKQHVEEVARQRVRQFPVLTTPAAIAR